MHLKRTLSVVAQSVVARFAVALLVLAPPALVAQDTASRGVRIGLRYDPGTKPGVAVLPISGISGDSIRTILERDFDYSDRLAVVTLSTTEGFLITGGTPAGSPVPLNYPLFAKLGAVAVVQATPSRDGLHVTLHDVAGAKVASTQEFRLPGATLSREWRLAVHAMADAVEEWITGRRGMAATRIAFVRAGVVRFVDSDGGQDQAIPVVGAAMSPSWHPGGALIAYNTYGPESRIVLYDLRTGRARDFGAQRNVTNLTPVFTPDGKSLVYSLSSENGADLFLMPLDGDAFPRRMTVGRGSENVQPSISPDGNRIAFMSDRTGSPQVYIMDADGTNADIFTAFDFGDQNYRASPDWSPDGRQVTFQSRIDGRFQIFAMSLRDRQPRQLTSEGENEDPSWAPDGRHIVFSSTRSGTRQLWILDTESGRLRQLTLVGGSRLPAWSPRLIAK
jgi:TolB protein